MNSYTPRLHPRPPAFRGSTWHSCKVGEISYKQRFTLQLPFWPRESLTSIDKQRFTLHLAFWPWELLTSIDKQRFTLRLAFCLRESFFFILCYFFLTYYFSPSFSLNLIFFPALSLKISSLLFLFPLTSKIYLIVKRSRIQMISEKNKPLSNRTIKHSTLFTKICKDMAHRPRIAASISCLNGYPSKYWNGSLELNFKDLVLFYVNSKKWYFLSGYREFKKNWVHFEKKGILVTWELARLIWVVLI